MITKGEKSAGKEDILRSAQPGQAQEPSSLLNEARSLGKWYWIRVSIGLLCVIFFAAFVPNAYLQWKYADVFQKSPCNLCQDLNSNQTWMCFSDPETYYNRIETTAWTIHPIKELGFKARWLQVPCDVCGEVERGDLQICLNQSFAPKKEFIGNKKIDFNLSGLSIPEGDISS